MNNDELIAAGHELAKCLDNEPLLDIAKMIVRLADKLDVTTLALREKTKQCEQLAAENAALKDLAKGWANATDDRLFEEHGEIFHDSIDDCEAQLKTICPATDAFLREVRAQARKDGAHFVANRMLAAWDAGFIDDTAKNAADIARMILSSTEFMADAPEGYFDRAFADSVLVEIASELRKGGAA